MNLIQLCDLTFFNPIGLKIAEYTTNNETLLKVKKEELYEGSQKRMIYWVPTIQK